MEDPVQMIAVAFLFGSASGADGMKRTATHARYQAYAYLWTDLAILVPIKAWRICDEAAFFLQRAWFPPVLARLLQVHGTRWCRAARSLALPVGCTAKGIGTIAAGSIRMLRCGTGDSGFLAGQFEEAPCSTLSPM
jgi:hypothetical protein